jgi:hypothetical protein
MVNGRRKEGLRITVIAIPTVVGRSNLTLSQLRDPRATVIASRSFFLAKQSQCSINRRSEIASA